MLTSQKVARTDTVGCPTVSMKPQSPPVSIAAFFDMDHTVLSGSSGKLYFRYAIREGRIRPRQWPGLLYHIGRYLLGAVDFPHLIAKVLVQTAGVDEAEVWRTNAAFFDAVLKQHITGKARERIAWHRSQGHRPVLVSAATMYVVRPVAEELGLGDAFLATRLAVVSGRLTGALDGQPCYGAGKATLAQAYAAAHDIDIRQSFFYSDSYSDMPLLEAVGHPIAVNPDRRLAQAAKRRGWPALEFN